ncbi:MAG: tRNA lysidine(34) synthetase TilS [Muribaculum sp.]|nr:tRNA lysidine(34) synthetase TilS [Muribaculum sp.]
MTQRCHVAPGSRLLVGLSGGADSVALASALVDSGFRPTAMHANFHLRGAESDRDAACAADVAGRLGIPLLTKDFDVEAFMTANPGHSVEMACRDLRYGWFAEVSDSMGDVPIAIAHHRDDNVETLFLNLMRGTGIAGLRGMRYRSGRVVRPMLDVPRSEVMDYLRSTGLPYVVDSSNLGNDYRRNQLRNDVLPRLCSYFPDAMDAAARTMSNLSSTEALLDELAIAAIARFADTDGSIDLRSLKAEMLNATTLLYWWIRPLGFNHAQCSSMLAAIDSDTPSGQSFAGKGCHAIINRGRLVISEDVASALTPIEFNPADFASFPTVLSPTLLPSGQVTFTRDNNIIYLDYDALLLTGKPLTLRPWHKGDSLLPFGMKGRRLVSDIFSDAHLSTLHKAAVPILALGDDILWVVGMRASRHLPVTSATRRVLILKYHPQR